MSWDNLYEQKRRAHDEDIEQIIEIQSELSTVSANQAMLQSVPRHMVRAVREVTEKLEALEREPARVKGLDMPFFQRVTTLFRGHADEWINDGEQALDTLGKEVENVRCLASALSEKETFNINKAMNLLTAASIIFLPLTLITGIYGMNFLQYADTDSKARVSSTNMPELYWEYGYLFSFGLMALAVVATSVLLWRMGVIGRKTKGRKLKKQD